MYTDRYTRSTWVFTTQVEDKMEMEGSGAFAVAISRGNDMVGDTGFYRCMLP
jgi:hypothetical protein